MSTTSKTQSTKKPDTARRAMTERKSREAFLSAVTNPPPDFYVGFYVNGDGDRFVYMRKLTTENGIGMGAVVGDDLDWSKGVPFMFGNPLNSGTFTSADVAFSPAERQWIDACERASLCIIKRRIEYAKLKEENKT